MWRGGARPALGALLCLAVLATANARTGSETHSRRLSLEQLDERAAVSAHAWGRNHSEPHHGKKHHHHKKEPEYDDGPDEHTPFKWGVRTIAAAIAASTCALLANAAGIGGGPLYVPLFNVVLGFDLKLCTGLSHSVVAVGAIASCIYGFIQRSPVDRSKTLLNFDIALTLIPAMLFGVSFGVLFNPLTPEWLQTALLGVLLVVVVRKIYAKGFKQWREEQKKAQKPQQDEEDSVRESLLEGGGGGGRASLDGRRKWGRAVSLSLDRGGGGVDEHFSSAHVEEADNSVADVAAHVVEEAESVLGGIVQRVPWLKAGALLALWVAFLSLQLEKARHPHCTWQFALVAGSQALLLGAVTVAYTRFQSWRFTQDPDSVDSELRKMMTTSLSGGDGDGNGAADLSHGPKHLAVVAAVVAMSGVIAGLLGIGGALIFNPYLLALGIHPQVTASTAVLIILFGSSSISLSFLFNGMLNLSYVQVYAPIAFCSSLLGVTVVGWAVRKSGRASIIVLLMATVILAGTVATLSFGSIRSVHDIQRGEIGFKPFCSS